MTPATTVVLSCLLPATLLASPTADPSARRGPVERKTSVSIVGDSFHINGRPTYEGREWQGRRIEGLLMNARLVQGIFDDRNPETVARWAYPDTGRWDAERNTREFIEAMPEWRRHGMLCAVVNLQGGSPEGYSREQPWHNSAIEADGSLHPDHMARLERIIERADELGMVIMLGVFYFGQDHRLEDERAVRRAVTDTVDWIADRGFTNVLLEIANEHDIRYRHDIIRHRPHELIRLAREQARSRGITLPVSVILGGGRIPSEEVVAASDFVLLHGNGVRQPERMRRMIETVRSMDSFRPMPVVNNEDDQVWLSQGFDQDNNLRVCVRNHVSWGYFDFRREGEPFHEGFQSVPVDWSIGSDRKRAFFNLLAEITGHDAGSRGHRNLHIYLLIGQSNMAGRARIPDDLADPIPRTLLLNAEDRWEQARNPLNRHSTIRKELNMQRLGPGHSFALEMTAHDPEATIGLIVNARGGSRIEEWAKGTDFYDEALRRVRAALDTGELRGILWHQGESNDGDAEYLTKLQKLIEDLRADLDMPELPFVAGQVRESLPKNDTVNALIAGLPEAVPFTAVAGSEGLTTFDQPHFDTESVVTLGRRYAEAMINLLKEADARRR